MNRQEIINSMKISLDTIRKELEEGKIEDALDTIAIAERVLNDEHEREWLLYQNG